MFLGFRNGEAYLLAVHLKAGVFPLWPTLITENVKVTTFVCAIITGETLRKAMGTDLNLLTLRRDTIKLDSTAHLYQIMTSHCFPYVHLLKWSQILRLTCAGITTIPGLLLNNSRYVSTKQEGNFRLTVNIWGTNGSAYDRVIKKEGEKHPKTKPPIPGILTSCKQEQEIEEQHSRRIFYLVHMKLTL